MIPLLDALLSIIKWIVVLAIGLLLFLQFPSTFSHLSDWSWPSSPKEAAVINPIVQSEAYSGIEFQEGEGIELVKKHCLGCHGAQLVIQNRMSRERWQYTIRWMQRTQGLWDLGNDEPKILDYLAQYYAPQKIGRRDNLQLAESEWYNLEQ